MMSQVDELDKSRFMEMSMAEFIEALVRVADKVPKENLTDFYPIHVSVSPWHLDKKLESLLITLIRKTLPSKLA